MPRALITGITGQDGSYLAELLLAKGYEVVGMVRRTSHHSYERIEHLLDRIEIVAADLLDQHSLTVVLQETEPDEVYNLAAQSYVPTSWTQPVLTGEFTALGVTRILEAIRLVHPERAVLPGQLVRDVRQGRRRRRRARRTPFYPRSPYGVAKVLRALDHGELPRVVRPVRRERHPLQSRIAAARHRVRHPQGDRRRRAHQARPGRRSFGSATSTRGATGASPATTSRRCGACCSSPTPQDYVIGTGETHSVRELVEIAFAHVGLDWRDVVIDPRFIAPPKSICFWPIPRRRGASCGWAPKVGFAASGRA